MWSEGFGYADAARMRPVTHQTQFRIGSVSKRSTGRRYPIARDSRLKPRLGTYR